MISWRYPFLRARYRKVARFLSGASQAAQTQRAVLLGKIRRNADSSFGREHGFAQIRSVADFRRQLPLTTYEDYRPYVERVKQGEISAMFGPGTKVLMFTMTSGTTGQSKFIPITEQFVKEYRRGWNLWGTGVYWDHLCLLNQYNIQLYGDWKKFHTEGGIPCGSISGLAADMAPWLSHRIFINLRPLMKITDPFAKFYTTLRLTLAKRNLGMLITANPSTLVELARLADDKRDSLVRDIYDGALSDEFDVPPEVRHALRRRIRPRQRKRARELERIIERTGALLPRDCWPNLEMLSVWTGGSVGAYLPQLKKYYGDLPVRDHGLSASEGRITIPFEDDTSAGVLDYASQYFEFIPEEEHGGQDPTILEAHELTPGKKYFVVLTTSSGFYRYDIRDVVECVGYQGEAPLLKFLNKGSHFSSITGEKISEYQVSSAVSGAFGELGFEFGLFTVASQWGDPPGYVLLMEPGPYTSRREELAGRIDGLLGQLNMEYADRIETRRLRPMSIQTIPAGSWDAFRRDRLTRGGSIEQYKHPCLINDLSFIKNLHEIFAQADASEHALSAGNLRP